jgi:hypothetical protein
VKLIYKKVEEGADVNFVFGKASRIVLTNRAVNRRFVNRPVSV